MASNRQELKQAGFRLGNAACCGSLGAVLNALWQRRWRGWLCLVAAAFYLLVPVCPAALPLPDEVQGTAPLVHGYFSLLTFQL
jgi:hypothetical protein